MLDMLVIIDDSLRLAQRECGPSNHSLWPLHVSWWSVSMLWPYSTVAAVVRCIFLSISGIWRVIATSAKHMEGNFVSGHREKSHGLSTHMNFIDQETVPTQYLAGSPHTKNIEVSLHDADIRVLICILVNHVQMHQCVV